MTDKMLNAGGESGRYNVAVLSLRARSGHNRPRTGQIPCRPTGPGGAAIMIKQQGERKSL